MAGLYQVSINFKKSRGHLKILSVRMLTCSKFHIRHHHTQLPCICAPLDYTAFFDSKVRICHIQVMFFCVHTAYVALKFFHVIQNKWQWKILHRGFFFFNISTLLSFWSHTLYFHRISSEYYATQQNRTDKCKTNQVIGTIFTSDRPQICQTRFKDNSKLNVHF